MLAGKGCQLVRIRLVAPFNGEMGLFCFAFLLLRHLLRSGLTNFEPRIDGFPPVQDEEPPSLAGRVNVGRNKTAATAAEDPPAAAGPVWLPDIHRAGQVPLAVV